KGELLRVECCMFVPVAFDWDADGIIDLIVGQEDGRVMFIRNSGNVAQGIPQFESPEYFRQQADEVKEGVLVTPCGVDWDNDGLEDLVCGNATGNIVFIKNLGGNPPRWAAPAAL